MKYEFDKASSMPRHEAHKKEEKSFEKKVNLYVFNPRGPSVSQIVNHQLHLIKIAFYCQNVPQKFNSSCVVLYQEKHKHKT